MNKMSNNLDMKNMYDFILCFKMGSVGAIRFLLITNETLIQKWGHIGLNCMQILN